jgi:hypothetical protein
MVRIERPATAERYRVAGMASKKEPHWIRGQSVAERYRYDLTN